MQESRRRFVARALESAPAVWVAFVLLVGAGCWWDAHRRVPWDIQVLDAMEYADIGRHLARGEGFTTSLIYPAELEFGVGHEHPSLVRPPVWPLMLAAGFALGGERDDVAQVLLGVLQLATIAAALALSWTLAGAVAGVAAGLAVATSPEMLGLSMLNGADPALALWFALGWLGVARRIDPFWVGGICALAYLTRYNGVALFVAVVCVMVASGGRAAWRDVARCSFGFAAVSLPWWVRNALVAGDPFFSLYRWGAYFSPTARIGNTKTLLNMLQPDIHSEFAMDPVTKLRVSLPMILLHWPPASANLSACVALVLGSVRRDRLAWGVLLLAVATTLIVAIALPRGRYFVPLVPSLLGVGAACWLRHGGRLRGVGLALLLLAPVLPTFPQEAADLSLYRAALRGPPTKSPRIEPEPWAACVKAGDLVLAEDASRVVWDTGAVTIWMAASNADFWTILERYPVDSVLIESRRDLLTGRFRQEFVAPPECGGALYRRRTPARK